MRTLCCLKKLFAFFIRPKGSLMTSLICALICFQIFSLTGVMFDFFKVQIGDNLRDSSLRLIIESTTTNGSCNNQTTKTDKRNIKLLITSVTSSTPSDTTANSSRTGKTSHKVDKWKVINILPGYYVFAYSAFYDDRSFPSVVKIHTIAPLRFIKTMRNTICIVRLRDGRTITTSNQVELQREHFSLPWASHFFNCLAENFKKEDIAKITVADPSFWDGSDRKIFDNHRALTVNIFPSNTYTMKTLAVCVKPIHFDYDKSLWLVEFLEMYMIQGASHFFLYNHTLSKNVEKILSHYIDLGMVTLLPWNLPIQSQKLIRTEAMFSAISDCIMRSVNLFRFLAVVDFDEYILPTNSPNLAAFVSDLSKKKPNLGAFNFRNVFHYLYWDDDQQFKTNETQPYLLTQGDHYVIAVPTIDPTSSFEYLVSLDSCVNLTLILGSNFCNSYGIEYKTQRVITPNKRGQRSKYVVRPETVVLPGNHIVWRLLKDFSQFNVPDSDALSHHYRICEFGGTSCTKTSSTIDRRAHFWSKDLFENVIKSCGKIFNDDKQCPDPPKIS